jgi:PncC family amidohydrolase
VSDTTRRDDAVDLRALFPLAVDAGNVLNSRGLTVAVAESCTGGLLGAALTAVPGSSRYVLGGVIVYSDSLKESLLGVPHDLLQRHGAVSREVAEAMASGVRRACAADIGLSVTGVAGPDGGSPDKPPGLIFVGAAAPSGVAVRRLDGDRGRQQNRAGAVDQALAMCIEAAGGQ